VSWKQNNCTCKIEIYITSRILVISVNYFSKPIAGNLVYKHYRRLIAVEVSATANSDVKAIRQM
jgi:hypothetical protein